MLLSRVAIKPPAVEGPFSAIASRPVPGTIELQGNLTEKTLCYPVNSGALLLPPSQGERDVTRGHHLRTPEPVPKALDSDPKTT